MRRGAPLPTETNDPAEESPPDPTFGAVPPLVSKPEPLRTIFEFELPRGYVDPSGTVHKRGAMRLATARDELAPMHDDRVRANPAYLTVVLLSRVITRLGNLVDDEIRSTVIEDLFASDLAFLQDLYRRINTEGHTRAAVTCPACGERFSVDLSGGGRS
jgi:hypothetical protein